MTGPHEPPPETGDGVVDAAVADLPDLADRPPAEHLEPLTAAHDQLQRALDPERLADPPTEA